jgi:hypothetical protein
MSTKVITIIESFICLPKRMVDIIINTMSINNNQLNLIRKKRNGELIYLVSQKIRKHQNKGRPPEAMGFGSR